MDENEQRAIEADLKDKIAAYHEAALLFTAVTAGLPDLLKAEPRSPEALAPEIGLQPDPLRRFLRGLATMRLCEEREDGRFALTPVGEALTHGHPSNLSEKAFVAVGQYWMPWMSLMYSLRTGKPSFPFALNKTVADWRGRNADEGRFFFRYVAKEELANPAGITDALGPLGDGTRIASLGGGYGAWLADVLNRHPTAEGIVVDAPPVLDDAKRLFDVLDLMDRISLVAGDVLEDVPEKADVYLLKGVLQQHDDAGAAAILKNCRAAMGPGARLLILERLMPDAALDDPAAVMLDLHMMAVTGGKARSKSEMEALIAEAGLTLAAVTEIEDGLSLIEAKRPDSTA